jgi:aminodeoxyfutalosine deaminase
VPGVTSGTDTSSAAADPAADPAGDPAVDPAFDPAVDPAVERFVADVPKVELHLHLVGSAALPTVLTLARRSPSVGVPTDEAALRSFYAFRDFAHFLDVYAVVNRLVQTSEDVVTLVGGLTDDLLAQRVRYAEVTVTPWTQVAAGLAYPALVEGLAEGRRLAAARGLELAWCFDIAAHIEPDDGAETAAWAVESPPDGLVSFGLGGAEAGVDRRDFAVAFSRARAAGLHSVPHAGEGAGGAASVWAALESLGAERIGHGIRSVDDPALLAHLAASGIPLEVCPVSNVRTRVVSTLDAHPLPSLMAAGVVCCINTDDPPMFGTDLGHEYRSIAAAFGLGVDELAGLVGNGVRASFLSADAKTALLAEVEEHRRVAAGGI